MAIILEDGTGITDANALVSVAELDAYLNNRNIDASDYDTEVKEAAIIIASYDFIDTYYCFRGTSLNEDQGMQVPTNIVDLDRKIKKAASAAAYLELQGKLLVSPSELVSRYEESVSKGVGSLKKATSYAARATYTTKYPTPEIDRLLLPFTVTGGLGSVARG